MRIEARLQLGDAMGTRMDENVGLHPHQPIVQPTEEDLARFQPSPLEPPERPLPVPSMTRRDQQAGMGAWVLGELFHR